MGYICVFLERWLEKFETYRIIVVVNNSNKELIENKLENIWTQIEENKRGIKQLLYGEIQFYNSKISRLI